MNEINEIFLLQEFTNICTHYVNSDWFSQEIDMAMACDFPISPLHVGISLRSALKGTLSGSLSVTLADESWKSPLIEDKKYN